MNTKGKFNIASAANLNRAVTLGQRDLFQAITGYELPIYVSNFGGASSAINQAKAWVNGGNSAGLLVLDCAAYTIEWDNTSRQPVIVNAVSNQKLTLADYKTGVAAAGNVPANAKQPQTQQTQPQTQPQTGGSMNTPHTVVSVPSHSGKVEKAAEATPVATPAVSPKPKAKVKVPERWRLMAQESLSGFVPHDDIKHLVPQAGPNGLALYEGKEIRFVTRECDEHYWYALKKYRCVAAIGPSGCGKDMSAFMFAFRNGLPYKVFPFGGSSRVEDMYGSRDLKAVNGVTQSPFVYRDDLKILRYGGLEVAGELNAAMPNELISLNQQIDSRTIIVQKTGEVIPFHDHAYITCNFNPGYEGTKPLNPATKGRFKSKIYFPAWTRDELYQLMGAVPMFDKLSELYLTIQKSMSDDKHPLKGGIISLRNLLAIQGMLDDGYSVDQALHEGLLNDFRCDTLKKDFYKAAVELAQKTFGDCRNDNDGVQIRND